MLNEEEEKLRKEWRLKKDNYKDDLKSFLEWLVQLENEARRQKTLSRETIVINGKDLDAFDKAQVEPYLRGLAACIAQNPLNYQGKVVFEGKHQALFETCLNEVQNESKNLPKPYEMRPRPPGY